MTRTPFPRRLWQDEACGAQRRGSFMTLGLFCLVVCMTFVAFSVDVGMISLTQTRMQNACDTAALAAAMEITYAIENADANVENVTEYAQAQAAAKAAEVASLNEVYVDPDTDVFFGHRTYNEETEEWNIEWGVTPSNVVKVVARRDNDDVTAADGKLQLLFAGVNGDDSASIRTSAVAYVEARDIVTVLDFSRSMNFDSYFASEYTDPDAYLSQAQLEANMLKVYQDLGSPQWGNMGFTPDWVTIPSLNGPGEIDVTWKSTQVSIYAHDYDTASDFSSVKLYFANGSTQTINYGYPGNQSVTAQGSGSNYGQLIKKIDVKNDGEWETFDFYNNTTIKRGLGLTGVAYPYAVGSWDNFIAMCRESSSSATSYYQAEVGNKGYRRRFGAMLMIQYILRFESGHSETADLWKTRHYPFTSVKTGEQLFCDFLEELQFGDQVGLVSYDTSHRIETDLSGAGMPTIDISGDPITDDYEAIRTIIEHKQAAHYSYATNMGGGLKDAKWLLDHHKRNGARPTILLMTDGNTNTMDGTESSVLPFGWNWDALFDYDGDGARDYESSDPKKRHALKIAKDCVDAGFTIHCMSVGADADTDLLEAIAWLGNGIYIEVPGGTSVEEMQDQVEEGFQRIAAFVPPARLLNPAE
jgi:Flp pilus assembly protein TadG